MSNHSKECYNPQVTNEETEASGNTSNNLQRWGFDCVGASRKKKRDIPNQAEVLSSL